MIEKSEAALLMLLGFAGFAVFLGLVYNALRYINVNVLIRKRSVLLLSCCLALDYLLRKSKRRKNFLIFCLVL